MFRKTFCPDKRLCFLAGKSDSTMLTARCVLLLRFATIRHYSPQFETIRDYSLFAIREYSLFGFSRHRALGVSGKPE